MTQKIEVLTCGLAGPYTISIDGKEITNVEEYTLYQDEPSGVHRVTFTVFTNNFQLRNGATEYKKEDKTSILSKVFKKQVRPTPNKTGVIYK